MNGEGEVVGAGCADSKFFDAPNFGENPEDPINLRCFEQKRRFGVDFLYPVERYSTALSQPFICPHLDDLHPSGCSDDQLVRNPLFSDLTWEDRKQVDPGALAAPPRSSSLIFLAGIVGVPWQDIAVSPNPGDQLVYRSAQLGNTQLSDDEKINWNWIVGDPASAIPTPEDPLMIESVDPRTGVNPATGEPQADVNAGLLANSINGHERTIPSRGDLQYACVFPLEQPLDCSQPEDADPALAPASCDCVDFDSEGDADAPFNNPLCQTEAGYSSTQSYAKAYPSLRQLQVLRNVGDNSIVASICPKEAADRQAADFGYRPAVAAIVDRLKEQLVEKCLPRELGVNADGSVPCKIVEAAPQAVARETGSCEQLQARASVEPEVAAAAIRSLESSGQCGTPGNPCESYRFCEITQLTEAQNPAGLASCLNDADAAGGDGWCYIDPAKGVGAEALVDRCAATERRKLRFVGAGTPDNGTVTFVACAGAVF